MENRNDKQERTEKNYKIIISILCIVVIVLLLLCVRGCSNSNNNPPITQTQPTTSTDLQIDPEAGDYVKPESNKPAQGVAIPGWQTITLPANTEEIVVDFFNPEVNEGLYYLTFELRLVDDSEQGYEVLYKSGLVEPGKHIQKIKLTRGLDSGIYDAFIYVQPYRMDKNKTPTNDANLKTELIVI